MPAGVAPSAALARNLGAEHLTDLYPDLAYVQFIDGDCVVEEEFTNAAVAVLDDDPGLAAVCGYRVEMEPHRNVFHRIAHVEWQMGGVGDVPDFAGDVVLRLNALRPAGGYSPEVVAGEDPELASRLVAAGWRIRRLDMVSTAHDIAMSSVRQWWARSRRGGYGSLLVAIRNRNTDRLFLDQARRNVLWGVVAPAGGACAGATHPRAPRTPPRPLRPLGVPRGWVDLVAPSHSPPIGWPGVSRARFGRPGGVWGHANAAGPRSWAGSRARGVQGGRANAAQLTTDRRNRSYSSITADHAKRERAASTSAARSTAAEPSRMEPSALTTSLRYVGVDEPAGRSEDPLGHGGAMRNHRQPRGHRLDVDVAEGLEARGVEEHVGRAVDQGHLVVGEGAPDEPPGQNVRRVRVEGGTERPGPGDDEDRVVESGDGLDAFVDSLAGGRARSPSARSGRRSATRAPAGPQAPDRSGRCRPRSG